LRRAPQFSIERAVQAWIAVYESVTGAGQRRSVHYAD
jgi:hypothetical protein